MKNYDLNEKERDNQACRDLWAEVLNNAMDLSRKRDLQSRKFIQERTGTFNWICEQLDLDPSETSNRMMAAIEN